jgi:hypothetical protein
VDDGVQDQRLRWARVSPAARAVSAGTGATGAGELSPSGCGLPTRTVAGRLSSAVPRECTRRATRRGRRGGVVEDRQGLGERGRTGGCRRRVRGSRPSQPGQRRRAGARPDQGVPRARSAPLRAGFGSDPVSHRTDRWLGMTRSSRRAPAEPAPWHDRPAPLAELRRRFRAWHDPIPALLDATRPGAVLHHDVNELPIPLPSYTVGRVALLGDAAHAMTPNPRAAALAAEHTVEAELARYDAEHRPHGQAAVRRMILRHHSWALPRLARPEDRCRPAR